MRRGICRPVATSTGGSRLGKRERGVRKATKIQEDGAKGTQTKGAE
ncbi:MAG: hypothetical protein ABC606_00860 [Candidatus Methanosuratincola petrocarbonis]